MICYLEHALNLITFYSYYNTALYLTVREHPDMMSASEGEGGHGKADAVWEVA